MSFLWPVLLHATAVHSSPVFSAFILRAVSAAVVLAVVTPAAGSSRRVTCTITSNMIGGTSVPTPAQREQTVLFPFGKRGAIRRQCADSVQAGAAPRTLAQVGNAWQGPHELYGGGKAEFLDGLAPLAVRRRSCRCARWSTLTLDTLTLSAPGAREAPADAHARLDAIRRDSGRAKHLRSRAQGSEGARRGMRERVSLCYACVWLRGDTSGAAAEMSDC